MSPTKRKNKNSHPLHELIDYVDHSLKTYRHNKMEFHLKYRPKLLKQVVGQPAAIKTIKGWLKKRDKFPHAILFVGPSGCGKTTLARIIKKKLKCSDNDFREMDCAEVGGVKEIREMRSKVGLAPIGGKSRVWLIDEAHMLTADAQNALLKILEDTPRHAYFMLATTDPQKIKHTIKTRCHEVKVELVGKLDMNHLIADVMDKEGLDLSQKVVAKITEVAEGSARKALVLLNQVSELDKEADQINAVLAADVKRQAIEIARGLMRLPPISWGDMCKILKGVDEDPEQLRYMILGYCTTILLSNGSKQLMARADLVINYMRDNLYDSKRPGLIANCYEIVHSKR